MQSPVSRVDRAPIQHFARNAVGRDFAVGDIHGCFRLLERELDAVGFNKSTDRLFSVGDLVDRGPDSDRSLEWLAKPWFHAVRGNHEQMAIDVIAGKQDSGIYRDNGGEWYLRLPLAQQQLFADGFCGLPFAIDIETSRGTIGLVHADIDTGSWSGFVSALESFDRLSIVRQRQLSEVALWSRERITFSDTAGVPDLHALIVGHTPGIEVRKLGNVFFIDTGAVFKSGKLTVIDIETLQ